MPKEHPAAPQQPPERRKIKDFLLERFSKEFMISGSYILPGLPKESHCRVNVFCECILLVLVQYTDDPLLPPPGSVPDCHQWDTGAAEPRTAVIRLQGLPEPLPGDGRGPQRLCQGAAAGRGTPGKHTHARAHHH